MAEKKVMESVRYTFTHEEMHELGMTLAQETEKHISLEREKSEIAALLGAQIKESGNRMADLSRKISRGHEMREHECIVIPDTPKEGWKRLVSTLTGEIVKEVEMSLEERQQRRLDFEN